MYTAKPSLSIVSGGGDKFMSIQTLYSPSTKSLRQTTICIIWTVCKK